MGDHTAASPGSSWWILALDQRGHGRRQRRPPELSRNAYADDVVAVIDQLVLVLVGQSLGGSTAFLVAARRAGLVRSLVVADASPERFPDVAGQVKTSLESWPVPFPSPTSGAGVLRR